MQTPSASLKSVATQLAALMEAGSHDYALMEKLLAQLPATATELSNTSTDTPANTPATIGIWKATEKNGQITFRRDASKENEWYCWANIDEIKPKGDKKRILLFGESAARGYLYDPHYNVAKELQGVLKNLDEETEVIDLARVSMKLLDLLDLAFNSVQLEPDAVVIFAGNNWVFAGIEQTHDFNLLQEIYQQHSSAGVQKFLEDELQKIIAWAMMELGKIFITRDIPIIFIVPEYNLKDWSSNDVEQVIPRTSPENIAQWNAAKKQSESLINKKELQAAATAAQAMINADSSNPLGYERLAKCQLELGNIEAARANYAAARDTIIFGRVSNGMPRCTTAVRNAILQHGKACGMRIIDLPTIFATEYKGALPGRTLFLDNCHLTVKGIQLTVKHAANALIKELRGAKLPVIPASGIEVNKHMLAVAHFGAALYNAHHGQQKEIVLHHCNEALKLSPAVSDIMIRYIDFAVRAVPSNLCKTFREMIRNGDMSQHDGGASLGHPRNTKLLDIILIDAITDALAAAGHNIKTSVNEARVREHAIRNEEVDLLESFYSRSNYDEFSVHSGAAFFQARSTETPFYFVATGNADLSLTICYRTPAANSQSIYITLNNSPEALITLPATKEWNTYTFSLKKETLERGVNELKIEWPYLPAPQIKAGTTNADAFLNGMFPVIGEIYTLNIVTGRETGTLQTATGNLLKEEAVS